jgi:hypothetical protein
MSDSTIAGQVTGHLRMRPSGQQAWLLLRHRWASKYSTYLTLSTPTVTKVPEIFANAYRALAKSDQVR